MSMIYEMGSPSVPTIAKLDKKATQGCSAVIAQLPDGSIGHGRNLDYIIPVDAIKINFETTFYKNGKPLFVSVGPLGSGVSTGMRIGGWAFQQNTRMPNDSAEHLKNAKTGALPYGMVLREILETTPDYSTALQKLESTRFMAGSYFSLSGTKGNEGAIFAADANIVHSLPYPTTLTLDSGIGRWFLVQTNDDQWNVPHDWRRPLAVARMNEVQKDTMSMDTIENMMRTFPLMTEATVFTAIFNAGAGTHKMFAHPFVTGMEGAAGAAGIVPGR
jgi:hypothetical protein